MKNVQVIDAASNCTYDVYAAADEDFRALFPGPGQDVEFAEDFFERAGEAAAEAICKRLWKGRIDKKAVVGIHGTLFYGLGHKKKFYPTKRESEMVTALD